jgi:hypothetical protein
MPLAGLDQRGQHRPVLRAEVVAGEQSVLAIESDRPHRALDRSPSGDFFDNAVDPEAWLADVLTRLVAGWPNRRLAELTPWAWKAEQHAIHRAAA